MTYKLCLYVTGSTAHSQRAVENLRRICQSELDGRYELEIIDVLEHPDKADRDKNLATPTLVKRLPEPVRRIVGDLSDHAEVVLRLDLRSDQAAIPPGARELALIARRQSS
jgi:circadian clock protein KaiB